MLDRPAMHDRKETPLLPWIITAAALLIMGVAVGYSSTDRPRDASNPQVQSGAAARHSADTPN